MQVGKILLPLLILGNAFVALSANDGRDAKFIPASDSRIAYMGRISTAKPDTVRFTYPGVNINAGFTGTSLKMGVKPGSGSYMIEIDDELTYRLNIGPNDSIVTLAESLPEGNHKVRATYVLEGYALKPEFHGFYVDKGADLSAKPVLPKRKIEFIGNSITCGYGVEADKPTDRFSYDTENFYYTYAARTARNLDAQLLVVARSGIGVYRNYGSPREGCKGDMPDMYGQTLFGDSTELWDHSQYRPDVVCVNLGTNDVSEDKYEVALLEDGYRKFIKHLRATYPDAKIIMLTGSMLNGRQLQVVKDALNKVTQELKSAGDRNLYRFDFTPQTGSLGMGADYHPSIRQQQKMASELTAYLRKLMKW